MTRSERAIQASRANGALSRGPKTAAGKLRSSQNALKHGFSAKRFPVPTQPDPEFEQLSAAYHRDLQPINHAERELTADIVAAAWHVHRAWRAEGAIFAGSIGDLDDNLYALCLLARYQPACEHRFRDALRTLFALRLSPSPKIDKTNLEIPPAQREFVDLAIGTWLARARVGEQTLLRRTRKIDKTNLEVPQDQQPSAFTRLTVRGRVDTMTL